MSDFRKEFPDFDPETLPKLPEGFEDVSWHNDACPSFFNPERRLSIHVDYAKADDREFPESKRFGVFRTDENGGRLDADPEDFDTDDWNEVIAHLDSLKAAETGEPKP